MEVSETLPAVDAGMEGALRTLQNRDFLLSQKYQDQQWQADRVGAHKHLLDFERLFVKRMKALGVPVYAHNMVRTVSEQNALYVQGRSKLRGKAGPHVNGCAVDIVHGKRAWNLTRAEWGILGHIGLEVAKASGLKMVWGGGWKFYDPAHWELADWRRLVVPSPD